MIAHKSGTTYTSNHKAAVEEAVRLLSQQTAVQRWVCEVCGMVHTGPVPNACDSCGVTNALVQKADTHREIHSRW